MHHALRPPRSASRAPFRRALLLLAIASTPLAAAAQARVEESRDFDVGQGRIIAFYSAALTFTPAQAPRVTAPGALSVGLELGYVPQLNQRQRRVGDKPEATNLAPLFPRPRVGVGIGGGALLEASWIPPVRFFDVKANLVSVALSRPFRAGRLLRLTPRIAGTVGTVEGAITCSEDLATGPPDLLEYWGAICHARESADHFQPRHLQGELVGSWDRGGALTPYAAVGVRGDWTRFDIRVLESDGSVDDGQPILTMAYARPYGVLGASWRARPRLRTSVELLAAPGSLFTARVMGAIDAR